MSYKKIILPSIDPERAVREIGEFIIKKVVEQRKKGCVIGFSGGVDSTVSGACAAKVFKDRPSLGFRLLALMIPTRINNSNNLKDAEEVAAALGIEAQTIDLQKVVEAYEQILPHAMANEYHKGNNISRARANVLWTVAADHSLLVQGTGNLDEDYGIGYYTLTGDGAVQLSPIGGLSKRLVRQMALYFKEVYKADVFKRIAKKIPSAEIEPGQTDYGDIGYEYDVVELAMEGLKQGVNREDLAAHPQISKLLQKQIHIWNSMFGRLKFESPEDAIDDLLMRHQAALHKARLVCPDVAKVTLTYK